MMRTAPITPTPISGLRLEMDRLFDDLFGFETERSDQVAVDLWESTDAYFVRMALPGVDRSSLEVFAHDKQLVVRGHLRPPAADGATLLRQECNAGQFERVIPTPAPFDRDAIVARLEDGVLMVELPRTAATKPVRVTVD